MGASVQVFVDLSFQGRLRKGSELVGAEVLLFTDLLEEHGTMMLDVPGYCIRVPGAPGRATGHRIAILLKLLGVWTPLWLEVRQPGVLILYDR